MAAEALTGQLERIARELTGSDVEVQLERPRNADHGDLASNLALALGKRLGKPPREVAALLIEKLDLDQAGVESAEIAGPGFINFRFASAQIQAHVAAIIEADREYGRSAPTS